MLYKQVKFMAEKQAKNININVIMGQKELQKTKQKKKTKHNKNQEKNMKINISQALT